MGSEAHQTNSISGADWPADFGFEVSWTGSAAAGGLTEEFREVRRSSQSNSPAAKPFPLSPLIQSLQHLDMLPLRAARRNLAEPNEHLLERVRRVLIDTSKDHSDAGLRWEAPSLGVDDDDCVTLEWGVEGKRLMLFVSEHETEFLRAWGPHVQAEMEEGDYGRERAEALFRWLKE